MRDGKKEIIIGRYSTFFNHFSYARKTLNPSFLYFRTGILLNICFAMMERDVKTQVAWTYICGFVDVS